MREQDQETDFYALLKVMVVLSNAVCKLSPASTCGALSHTYAVFIYIFINWYPVWQDMHHRSFISEIIMIKVGNVYLLF